MEPKSQELPGQVKPRELTGSPWWDWGIACGPIPRPLTLELLHEAEERFTREQRGEYWRAFTREALGEREEDDIWWRLVHATAATKIRLIAQVLRGDEESGERTS